MQIIFSFFLVAFTLSLSGQAKNPFVSLKFDKVIMYDFEGSKDYNLSIVDNNGKLATSISKQIELDKASTTKLNIKLGDRKSYGESTAACFDPHLGFVYYLKGKIVGYITICLDCNRLYSSLNIEAQKQGRVGKGKDAYFIADGLSNSFRLFLNSLLKRNNFSHQIDS